jgi:hypothetical protein
MPFFRSSVRPMDDVDVLLGDAEAALDLEAGRLAHRDDAVEALGDDLLHEQWEVEGAPDLLVQARVDGEVGLAVEMQRVVNDGDDRNAARPQPEQSPAQALVVEDDVEAMLALQPAPPHEEAGAEALHLREDPEP